MYSSICRIKCAVALILVCNTPPHKIQRNKQTKTGSYHCWYHVLSMDYHGDNKINSSPAVCRNLIFGSLLLFVPKHESVTNSEVASGKLRMTSIEKCCMDRGPLDCFACECVYTVPLFSSFITLTSFFCLRKKLWVLS